MGLHQFVGYYWVVYTSLLGIIGWFTPVYWVLLGSLYQFIGYYWVVYTSLLGSLYQFIGWFTPVYWVLLGGLYQFIGYYWVVYTSLLGGLDFELINVGTALVCQAKCLILMYCPNKGTQVLPVIRML